MTKQDFLDGLRRSLSGGLEAAQVNEHIRYYSDYIDTQIRMGVTEEEVMASLGEPRLIAKTLLGMEEAENVTTEEYIYEEETKEQEYRHFNVGGKSFKLPSWLFTILVCVVSFFVLTVVFALMTRLIPYLFLIIFVVSMFRFFKNLFR